MTEAFPLKPNNKDLFIKIKQNMWQSACAQYTDHVIMYTSKPEGVAEPFQPKSVAHKIWVTLHATLSVCCSLVGPVCLPLCASSVAAAATFSYICIKVNIPAAISAFGSRDHE